MNKDIRIQLYPTPKGQSRHHHIMMNVYGRFRPGKTSKDKARGVQRFGKNRRIWDAKERRWVKV